MSERKKKRENRLGRREIKKKERWRGGERGRGGERVNVNERENRIGTG